MSIKMNIGGKDLMALIDKHPEIELDITKGTVANVANAVSKKLSQECFEQVKEKVSDIQQDFCKKASDLILNRDYWSGKSFLNCKSREVFEEVIIKEVKPTIDKVIREEMTSPQIQNTIRNTVSNILASEYTKVVRDEASKNVEKLLPELLEEALKKRFGSN